VIQGDQLLDALSKIRAVKSGLLKGLAEAELFMERIGRVTVSDFTTNLIRRL
jgi:hypothetical protein